MSRKPRAQKRMGYDMMAKIIINQRLNEVRAKVANQALREVVEGTLRRVSVRVGGSDDIDYGDYATSMMPDTMIIGALQTEKVKASNNDSESEDEAESSFQD